MSKQSNRFFISARRGAHLFLSLCTVISISFASNGFAQTLSGGAGGNGHASLGGAGAGGADSVTGVGSNGFDSGSPIPFSGGGGGGAGISGGNGGTSIGGPNLGGAGGVGAGAAGQNAPNSTFDGGGGGGGGAAGAVITSSSSNTLVISGGSGGAGGLGGPGAAYTAGGGGGAGGFGAIVNTGGITYTNSGSILGGNGGAGGANNTSGISPAGGDGGSGGVGVYLGNLTTLINTGIITGGNGGAGGANNNLNGVAGTAGSSAPGVYVAIGNSAAITNTGTITGGSGSYGIQNAGTVSTLNNAQGAASSALTYTGALPTNYNIIINNANSYGKLAVSGGTGSTTFGIYSSSTVRNGTYASVLIGLTSSQVTNTFGTYGGYSWTLGLESGSPTIWDLSFASLGPSVANTNQSLVNTAQALQGTYTLQNAVLANSFAYDCTVFGENDICVSAGGRNTAVSAANGLNNSSALLIAAYRALPSVRIGAYADQNLSVNNAGSTVNLGNNTPLIGLFAAWNERQDGTGSELKVSAAYGQKNTTVTRQVVGTGATASEAGSGSSTLNSQGAQVTAKYGFGIADQVIVSPYVGIRYTQNNMGGYTEATSTSVTTPLTYSALNTNATTALAGVGVSYSGIPQTNLFASAGVETDTNTANGSYNATGLTGLAPVNFNPNPVKTRPTAMLGASYDVEKNQRLGVTGIYRQEAYQATASTTVMATYTVGF